MITYQIEKWDTYYPECTKLWEEYYEEINDQKQHLKLDMDINKYSQMSDTGLLQILTVRDDGKLIGFFFAFVTTHLRYATVLCGFQDLLYLSKPYRAKSSAGLKLIKGMEQHLKELGCAQLYFGSHHTQQTGKILEHLGFQKSDVTYTKHIG